MSKVIYCFSNFIKVIKNNNRVIIANIDNGEWIKISVECYEILNDFLDKKMNLEEIENSFIKKDDKEYFRNMIAKMYEKELLHDIDDSILNSGRIELEMVTLSVTKRCNLKCLHCAYDAGNEIDDLDLSFEEIMKITDKLVSCNTKKITITGGEPLLREDLIEILNYIKKSSECKICLMTNATLITEQLAEQLVKLVDKIDISIDGVNEETCSFIRGKGVFQKVIDSIVILQAKGFKDISLSMVTTKENSKYVNEFNKLNEKLGTMPLIRGFNAEGRGEKNRGILTDFDKEKHVFGREVIIEKPHAFKCKAACNQFFIDFNGDIYPCPILIRNEYKIDNILNIDSLSELIISKKSLVYSKLDSLKPYNYNKCRECNVNVFCWTCYERIDMISRYPEKFQERCAYRKKELEELIWKE